MCGGTIYNPLHEQSQCQRAETQPKPWSNCRGQCLVTQAEPWSYCRGQCLVTQAEPWSYCRGQCLVTQAEPWSYCRGQCLVTQAEPWSYCWCQCAVTQPEPRQGAKQVIRGLFARGPNKPATCTKTNNQCAKHSNSSYPCTPPSTKTQNLRGNPPIRSGELVGVTTVPAFPSAVTTP